MCRSNFFIIILLVLMVVGCKREGFSPVEIKIEEGSADVITNRANASTYVVSNGETLFDIANKHNIDPMNLAKINGIEHPYNVEENQTLRLPVESLSQNNQPDNKHLQYDEQTNSKALDDEFSEVMKIKEKPTEQLRANKKNETSFNEQENVLSTPKMIKSKKMQPLVPNKMSKPVDGDIVSNFGDVSEGVANDGINIKAPLGTPVKAAADGEVIYAGNKLEDFGNTVVVQHNDKLITSYAHLGNMNVKSGSTVSAGDVIGSVGKTGDVETPQLHFEVLKDKLPVNPTKYLE